MARFQILLILSSLFILYQLSVTSGSLSSYNNNVCIDDDDNSTDHPVVKLVGHHKTGGVNSSLYSEVQFNCSAAYPIEWAFATFPREIDWNVSYIRIAEDVLEEESWMTFNSTLTLYHVTASGIARYGITCRNVVTFCASTISDASLLSLDKNYISVKTEVVEPNETHSNCSLHLWFDAVSKQYFCSTTNETVRPRLAFVYCSNPTECGVRSEKAKCISRNVRNKTEPTHCNKRNCTKMRLEGEFHIPKLITCWDDNLGEDVSSVDIPGYFHTSEQVKDVAFSSYMKWEELKHPEDPEMLTLQVSDEKTLANESFDLSCVASYYYFAQGMHLTLKHLSNPSFTEMELKNTANLTIERTLELSAHGEQIPLRRSLLAQGITLNAGDYQATCYAPVWNSTKWVTKSVLISISDAIVPIFLTGNRSREIQFAPNKNVTCLARGNPPPRLSWVYDQIRIPPNNVFETAGSQKGVTWSVLTLPASFEGFRIEFKCHAQNTAGYDEKLFIVNKDDESVMVTTKIAAGIIVIGFITNLVVGYFCWKYLFSEEADTAVVKFVRSLRQRRLSRKAREQKENEEADHNNEQDPGCPSQNHNSPNVQGHSNNPKKHHDNLKEESV